MPLQSTITLQGPANCSTAQTAQYAVKSTEELERWKPVDTAGGPSVEAAPAASLGNYRLAVFVPARPWTPFPRRDIIHGGVIMAIQERVQGPTSGGPLLTSVNGLSTLACWGKSPVKWSDSA